MPLPTMRPDQAEGQVRQRENLPLHFHYHGVPVTTRLSLRERPYPYFYINTEQVWSRRPRHRTLRPSLQKMWTIRSFHTSPSHSLHHVRLIYILPCVLKRLIKVRVRSAYLLLIVTADNIHLSFRPHVCVCRQGQYL